MQSCGCSRHRVAEVLHAHDAAQPLLEQCGARVREVRRDGLGQRRHRGGKRVAHARADRRAALGGVDKVAGAFEEPLARRLRRLADVRRRVLDVLLEERQQQRHKRRDVGRVLDECAQVGRADGRLFDELVVCVLDAADNDRHHKGERRAVHRVAEGGHQHLLHAVECLVRLLERVDDEVAQCRRDLGVLHARAEHGQRLLCGRLDLCVRVVEALDDKRDALGQTRAHRARRLRGEHARQLEALDADPPSAADHAHALVQRADDRLDGEGGEALDHRLGGDRRRISHLLVLVGEQPDQLWQRGHPVRLEAVAQRTRQRAVAEGGGLARVGGLLGLRV
mmetsp:Transcript_20373/g.66705  ORF Transcript_20373/g.66705 Transcript_20373/m.66705 type:complete len:337 (+) Transcript_20373:776-1786(+)